MLGAGGRGEAETTSEWEKQPVASPAHNPHPPPPLLPCRLLSHLSDHDLPTPTPTPNRVRPIGAYLEPWRVTQQESPQTGDKYPRAQTRNHP